VINCDQGSGHIPGRPRIHGERFPILGVSVPYVWLSHLRARGRLQPLLGTLAQLGFRFPARVPRLQGIEADQSDVLAIGRRDRLSIRIDDHRQECRDKGPDDEREPARCVLKRLAVLLELPDAFQRILHALHDGRVRHESWRLFSLGTPGDRNFSDVLSGAQFYFGASARVALEDVRAHVVPSPRAK
jgi:hypothetical protein